MTLKSNNPRITNVYMNEKMDYMEYFIDGKGVEVDGIFNFITGKDKQYIGVRETAVVRDENDDVIEEVEFEAYFE